MSAEKTYGDDGPPQFYGLGEGIPPEVLKEWIAAGGTCVWTFRDPEWWRKHIRCSCGDVAAFEVRTADARHPDWIGGKIGGRQRCDLRCTKCAQEIQLFDDGIHGYNAVICGERSTLPPAYRQSNHKTFACSCKGTTFAVIAEAMYNCGDNLESMPESQWDEAYGAFAAFAKCVNCGSIHEIVEAETA